MRGTRLAVGVVVVSLLAVGAAAGPAAAQVDSADEADVCEGAPANGDSLVVVLPDDRYVHADQDITLLPGTEADIALCSGGELVSTSAWPVSGDIAGVDVSDAADFSYPITITPVTEEAGVAFGPAIEQRGDVNTPSVTVTPGRVTEIDVGGDSYDVAIDGTGRERLVRASSDYETAVGEMQTTAADLDESAGEITPDHGVPDDERVPTLNQTRAVNDNYTHIQSVLFAANATAALSAYEARHTGALDEVSGKLKRANGKIAAQARSAAIAVLGNFVGLLVGGVIVGGVSGWFATNRILSRVEVKRRRSSAVDFRPKHLAGQVAIAVVLVGGAIGLAFVRNLLGPLVAAIRAVIGV